MRIPTPRVGILASLAAGSRFATVPAMKAGTQKDLPYGSWPSPITAKFITTASVRLGSLSVDREGELHWLEGRPQEIIPSLKEIYVEVMLTNYKLWIPMQLLNFGLIPVQYQVLMSNITALVWNTYLSYINRAENRGG